jgi:hypothetical protein
VAPGWDGRSFISIVHEGAEIKCKTGKELSLLFFLSLPLLLSSGKHAVDCALNSTAVIASGRPDPGLKAAQFGPVFRGLKPPAPSGFCDLQL